MYEAKFLTGMIAGAMCTNDRIGYVADYPLYGVAASINAFALGAKMVNPRVKVYLAWSSMKDFDIDRYFEENNITYISAQDMITPQNDNRQFGLYEITEYGKKNLAMSIYDWGVFYEKLIHSIQKGSYKAEESGDYKAINYWWGLSAGVIDVICSKNLPIGTVKLVDLMKQTISSGLFHPFTGPLTDQKGHKHYAPSEAMKPDDIMKMDWLVENVVGKIPTIDELKEDAQPVVMLRGLHSATADKGGNSLP
jgi:basic membrane lipoprotein Med (substrate-binding protein (PBP1-ABC) superfamily)